LLLSESEAILKRQATGKINYLYGRLSNEDAKHGDSLSIENQRKILTKYAEENGLAPCEFIYDDGYSGGDWERPAFCKMIEDVEAGKVAAIVVKDLSRFGRGYLKVGFYQEILFPRLDVRLIAIHDNIDSDEGESDFAPFINLFNEWFLKTTSQKIRAVKHAQGKAGERLAVIPIYGYRKDPDNNKTLIVDDESAAVVRRIFRLSVEGLGPAQIARMLNAERLLNPSAYKYEHGIMTKMRPMKDPYFWNATTIHKILDAPEYLGMTINFKTYSKSYKDNRPRLNTPDKHMIFEDSHPAIIDTETWEIVRRMREHKRRAPRYGDNGLFSGSVYCSDCKAKLYFSTREIWNKAKTLARYEGAYSCSAYRKQVQFQDTGRRCTCHYIREEVLEQIVLDDLQELLALILQDEKRFVRLVMDKSQQDQERETQGKRKELAKLKKRIEETDTIIERLYLDNIGGKLSDERYEKMAAKFEEQQAAMVKAYDLLKAEIGEQDEAANGIEKFLATVRRYTTEIEKLTPAIVHEFIDKIIVHEPEQARGNRRQEVEIVYHRIGKFDLDVWQEKHSA
jgi:DNA invertase Pin-like site-specific DNA recombinase